MNRLNFLPRTRTGWALGFILTAIFFWIYYFPVIPPPLQASKTSFYEKIQRAYYESYSFNQQYQRIYENHRLQIEIQTPQYVSSFIPREMVFRINNLVEDDDIRRREFNLDLLVVAQMIMGSPDQPMIQQIVLPIQSEHQLSEFSVTGTNVVRVGEIPIRATITEQVWLRASREITEGLPIFVTFFVRETESTTPRRLTPVGGETNCDEAIRRLNELDYDTEKLFQDYRLKEKVCLIVDTDKTIQQAAVQTILLPPWANGFLVIIALLLAWLFEWTWDIGVSKSTLKRKLGRVVVGLVWLVLCVIWGWTLTELFVWRISDTNETLDFYVRVGMLSFPISLLLLPSLIYGVHTGFASERVTRAATWVNTIPQSMFSGLKSIAGRLWAGVQLMARSLGNLLWKLWGTAAEPENGDPVTPHPNPQAPPPGGAVAEQENLGPVPPEHGDAVPDLPSLVAPGQPNGHTLESAAPNPTQYGDSEEGREEGASQSLSAFRIKSRIEQCREKIAELHQTGVLESGLTEFWDFLRNCQSGNTPLMSELDYLSISQLIALYRPLIGEDAAFDYWFLYCELINLPPQYDNLFVELTETIRGKWHYKSDDLERFEDLSDEFKKLISFGLEMPVDQWGIDEKMRTDWIIQRLFKIEQGRQTDLETTTGKKADSGL
jgi:hypothetical protein